MVANFISAGRRHVVCVFSILRSFVTMTVKLSRNLLLFRTEILRSGEYRRTAGNETFLALSGCSTTMLGS